MSEQLLIVGGSVRAAVMSAQRAGFEPLAIDRFADADLRQVCPAFQRYEQLRQLPKLAGQMPLADWMYTGPIENYPTLLEQVGGRRGLLGNGGAALRRLRDPWHLAAALREAGLPTPELRAADEWPAGDDWLSKPLRAAGGFGIARLGREQTKARDEPGANYLQRFIRGRSLGATFVAASGRAVLVGVTEQLLGPAWGGAHEFQYVGSVGPVILSSEQTQAFERIGNCIAERFSVRGLFGVDAIVNEEGVWPVEVNPRYTASVEIIERVLRVAAIRWHVAACRSGELPDLADEHARTDRFGQSGKAVVYADCELFVDADRARALCARNLENADPMVADIPVAGTRVQRGEPLVTVFAQGRTGSEVKEGLRAAITEVKRSTAWEG